MANPRRQSWGGDVETSFAILQQKYNVGSDEVLVEGEKVGGGGRGLSDSWFWGLLSWAFSAVNGVKVVRRRQPRVHDNDYDRNVPTTEKVEVPNSPPQSQQSFTKFKYINGPAGASATKSFRHGGPPTQQFNSPDLETFKSKNHRYMSQSLREQEQGVVEPNKEEKRKQRGFAAVDRQMKKGGKGRTSASIRIKAFSYGSAARAEANS